MLSPYIDVQSYSVVIYAVYWVHTDHNVRDMVSTVCFLERMPVDECYYDVMLLNFCSVTTVWQLTKI